MEKTDRKFVAICYVTVFAGACFINLLFKGTLVELRPLSLFPPLKVGQISKPMSHYNTAAAANENIHPYD